MRVAGLLGVLAALGLSCGHAEPGRPLPAASTSHVVTIVMENKEYGQMIGARDAAYVNRLARRYGLATSSYDVRHPSLPDYLALTSGSTHGIDSDCTGCHVRARNIVDQLEAARISWKAYMEDIPRPCFKGASHGGYAKKHNPFAYYDDVSGNPRRCQKIVPLDRLAEDLRAAAPLDHYGVLRTVEDSLGLPRLGAARDARHGDLGALFRRAPRIR